MQMCSNCANLIKKIDNYDVVYSCSATDISSTSLLIKILTGAKPFACKEWKKKEEDKNEA